MRRDNLLDRCHVAIDRAVLSCALLSLVTLVVQLCLGCYVNRTCTCTIIQGNIARDCVPRFQTEQLSIRFVQTTVSLMTRIRVLGSDWRPTPAALTGQTATPLVTPTACGRMQ